MSFFDDLSKFGSGLLEDVGEGVSVYAKGASNLALGDLSQKLGVDPVEAVEPEKVNQELAKEQVQQAQTGFSNPVVQSYLINAGGALAIALLVVLITKK